MAEPHRSDYSPPAAESNGTRGGEESHENGDRKTTYDDDSDKVVGSPAIRPIFLGNLIPDYTTEDVTRLFENPAGILPSSSPVLERTYRPFPVDHVDLKRGYCFVFLKDATSQSHKNEIDAFVEVINGISIPNVSRAVRVEFARGDGRVKRKEDERRRYIAPCDTLFVVNFSEETTKKQDLEMLFEPFGELVRIDMKQNYAFVQFRTVEQATKAKQGTDGGKLQQNYITVEFVVRQPRDRDRDNQQQLRRDGRRGPSSSYSSHRPHYSNSDGRGGRYDDRVGGGGGSSSSGRGGSSSYPPRSDSEYRRRSSPPPRYSNDNYNRGDRDRDRSPPGYRGRSRSRSPPPPRRAGRYDNDDYDAYPRGGGGGGGGGGGRYASSPPSRRGSSPPRGRRNNNSSPPRGPRGPSPPPSRRGTSPPSRGGGRGSSPPARDRGASPPSRRGPSPPPPPERYHRGGDRDRGYRGAN